MRSRYIVVMVLILGVTPHCRSSPSEAGAATSSKTSSDSETSSERTIEPIPVEAMEVSNETFRETSEVPGTIAPLEAVDISVEQPGRIVRLSIEEGDRVEAGQRLLQLGTNVERARIERLEHAVEAARREFERTQRLREDGLATPQELDRAETELRDAELQLEEATVSLDRASVRSPTSGTVIDLHVEAGEYASPGRPVVEVATLSTLEVTAAIPSSRIGAIQEGDSLEVEVPALGATFRGTVAHRPTMVDDATRTYPVEIHVDNDDRRIRPGMRASLTLTRKVWKDAIVIPRTAVLQGYTRREIAVLPETDSETERATIRDVTLGPSAGARVVVTEGLEPGERLIVRGHRSLMEEAPVQVVETYEGLDAALEAGL